MRPLEVFERPHCACCGQLVTWKTVEKTIENQNLNFCGDQCVEVFTSYLLPSRGTELFAELDRTAFAQARR